MSLFLCRPARHARLTLTRTHAHPARRRRPRAAAAAPRPPPPSTKSAAVSLHRTHPRPWLAPPQPRAPPPPRCILHGRCRSPLSLQREEEGPEEQRKHQAAGRDATGGREPRRSRKSRGVRRSSPAAIRPGTV